MIFLIRVILAISATMLGIMAMDSLDKMLGIHISELKVSQLALVAHVAHHMLWGAIIMACFTAFRR